MRRFVQFSPLELVFGSKRGKKDQLSTMRLNMKLNHDQTSPVARGQTNAKLGDRTTPWSSWHSSSYQQCTMDMTYLYDLKRMQFPISLRQSWASHRNLIASNIQFNIQIRPTLLKFQSFGQKFPISSPACLMMSFSTRKQRF